MQNSDHPLKPENLGQGHKRPRPQSLLCHRLPGDLEQIPLSLSGPLGKTGWGWEGLLDSLGPVDCNRHLR